MPARDHRGHRVTGRADVGKGRERNLCRLRLGDELDGDLGDDGQQALGPVDQREQVVTGAVQRLAPELDHLAGDQHATDPADVVHRESVLDAVQAARILGDVAADRARDLRRRIGRVIEVVRRRRLRNREIASLPAGRPRCAPADRPPGLSGTWPATAGRRACRAMRPRTGSCRRRAPRPARVPRGNA